MASTNERLADAAVSHQIGIQRYSTATVRKIRALLARVEARVLERLGRSDLTALSRARQEALLEALRRIIVDGYVGLTDELTDEVEALAVYERDYQLEVIRRALPVVLDTVVPTDAQMVAAVNSRPFQGRVLKDWLRGVAPAAAERVRDTIRMGFVEGRPTAQIVRDIRGTRALGYKDGVLEISRRGAETMVRTAINHTANAARAELYRQNASIIKGVQWISTLDGLTSAICRARDGRVYPVDSGPRPPAHPGCRSSTAPVVKSWRELGISLPEAPPGTRASLNGQVSADLTYDGWLRRQPVAVQEDVLGVQKARLFRRGELPIERFVDRRGREYTLAELRLREAEAFERAAA